jgi:hypothetical protein
MSATQKPFLDASQSAVRVGRMWVSAKALARALTRFARLLFCLNQSEQHPYTLRGSATGLRWQNRCMLFWCKHQTVGYRPDDVVVPFDKAGKILISGSTFVQTALVPVGRGIF